MKDTKEMSDAKTASELADEYASKFPRKSEWDKHERYSTLMLYEVRDEVEEAFESGHSAGLSEGVSSVSELIAAAELILRNPVYTSQMAVGLWENALAKFNANRGKGM